ncbi:hypothetical protein [Celeribacter naphthalenivorans]|uniref:hypothetical protein n=1 Tax=Celeribacter naphthalenivorans TaxID=1614694 RepID=UPI001CFB5649|nr:hypothetical protein [Celeribacter naphthalenivorans]
MTAQTRITFPEEMGALECEISEIIAEKQRAGEGIVQFMDRLRPRKAEAVSKFRALGGEIAFSGEAVASLGGIIGREPLRSVDALHEWLAVRSWADKWRWSRFDHEEATR